MARRKAAGSLALALLAVGMASALPALASAKTVYLYNVRQGWLVRPATLDFCSSGCEYGGLRWKGWNGKVATGKGFFTPYVSSQLQGTYPVRIVLSGTKRCPNGRTIYSSYTETLTGERPSGYPRTSRLGFSCKGFLT